MKIWILRHGQAEPMAASDPLRALTQHGREEAVKVAQLLAGEPLDTILASPYLRAQQTADQVCRAISYPRAVSTAAWLTPDDDPRQALDFLAERTERHLLLVSHQPLVSQFISLLVDGHKGGHYPMPTAGLACIETDFPAAGIGQLLMLTSPGELPA
ncbi:phosphohistidine phosphatase SixA [uncultured Halopseudomonas sp.]|uniref:phosphohistidine phosphatase SixA n=1 Tax=uncultured Halopseudomonas sp. TaxID=2901193 RepID=UPI0030EBF923|tara:strand:+ start:5903 stop:6373 length:471 start_codon:yes stop_codon:yes gene_type:complete